MILQGVLLAFVIFQRAFSKESDYHKMFYILS